jgi:hypothetical protein
MSRNDSKKPTHLKLDRSEPQVKATKREPLQLCARYFQELLALGRQLQKGGTK